MVVRHILTSPIADVTGTVTIFNSAGVTVTTNATALVRPSDWNSAHIQQLTLSGNTAGASTLSGSNLVFQGGANITLSGSDQTVIISAPNQSVQTQGMVSLQGSTGAIVFANSNGLSFGGNASTITASHNGLTTAAQSNHSHGDPSLALTNLSGSTASASNGLTLSLSVAAPDGGVFLSAAGSSQSAGNVVFSNSNGVSFGMAGSTVTAQHNGLTTARASNDAVGLNTALTGNGVAWTVNSSGISLNVPAFLTTAALSNHSHGDPTLALTNLSGTTASNSNGLTLSLSAAAATPDGGVFISAAGSSQSAGNIVFSNSNGISFGMNGSTITATVNPGAAAGLAAAQAGTQTATSGTLVFADSNGITFGLSGSSQLTASYTVPSVAGFLTTARASNDAIGLATAQTNVTWTANSAGLSLNAAGYAGTGTSKTGGAALTLNSNGLQFDGGALAGTGFTSTTTAGTAIVATQNTAGLSLAFPSIVTNALTTARASTDAIGLNTALTANGVSMTANSSGLSLNFPAFLTTQSGQAFSADASSTFQTLVFQDSNGVSFSNNAGALRITHGLQFTSATSAITSNALHSSASRVINAVVATNNTGGGTASLSGNVSFSNANGATFYSSAGGAVVLSYSVPNVAAFLTTARASTDALGLATAQTNVTWTANSAGVSLNAAGYAGTTTAVTGNAALTLNSLGLRLDGSGLAGTSTGFGGTNISMSMTHNSAGINISASVAAPGAGGGIAGAAGTQTATSGTMVFANSNGITFGMSGSSQVTASYTVPDVAAFLTTAALSNHSHGNPTLALTNLNGTTASASNGLTLSLSAAAQSVVPGIQSIAFANTTFTTGAVSFSNANGISFGSSAGQVTASHNALTTARASTDALGLATAQTNVTWTANSAGLSLNAAGYAGTTTAITGNAAITLNSGGLQFNGASLAGTSTTFNGANISASMTHNSAGLALSMSVAAPGAGGGIAAAAGTQTATSGTVVFANSNNITFGMSGSSQVTASFSQSNQTANLYVSGANSTQLSSTAGVDLRSISVSGAGGVSAGVSQGVILISGPALTSLSVTGALSASSNGSTISLGVGTVSVTAASNTTQASSGTFNLNAMVIAGAGNVSVGVSNGSVVISGSGGGVTPVASASNGSFSFTTLAFSNANNVTFGTSAGSIITASVAAPGAAAENNAIALLGANTAGNTTATGSTIGWSGVNLTLSGTNASQVVISAPATSSLVATGLMSISTDGSTISMGVPAGTATLWQPFNEALNVAGQQGQAIMHFAPLPTPVPAALGELQVDRLCIPLILSNSSNSTGSVTISYSFGLYTKNVSTLSLHASTSYTVAATFSGTVNNSTFAGLRLHTVPWTTTIGDGRYFVAHWSRTTTGGGNATFNQWLASQANSNYSGLFGGNSNRSHQYPIGYGAYSVSFSTAMPNSVAFSAIDGTGSIVARPPSFFMVNGTV